LEFGFWRYYMVAHLSSHVCPKFIILSSVRVGKEIEIVNNANTDFNKAQSNSYVLVQQ